MSRKTYRVMTVGLAMALALGLATLALAAGPSDAPGSGGKGRTFTLPPQAATVRPGLATLGRVQTEDGVVEGYVFLSHREGQAKGHAKKQGSKDGHCFTLLGKGAKWKSTEPYIIDPTNARGLDETVVRTLMATSLAAWDTPVAFDIFGSEDTAATVDGIDLVQPDGKNEVLFGDWDTEGVIAVAVVWGVFSGPTSRQKLVEWDILFDHADFDWSTDGSPDRMDFQNVAAHEAGHAAGMGHPADACIEETMYGFIDYGEMQKRDLNGGDTRGVTKLYH